MTDGRAVAVDGIRRRYRQGTVTIDALAGLSFAVTAGACVAIMGPSGSGKSTLLHLLGAMDTATAGEIRVGDTVVTGLSPAGRVAYRRTVGFVFQQFHLLAALTVEANIAAPVLPLRVAFDKRARARELAAAVGLGDRVDALPSQLSGGERQRVAIARALVNRPGLLLADEPTGNLDSATGREVIDLLLALQRDGGATVLIATHDRSVAERCDRVIELADGRIADDSRAEP